MERYRSTTYAKRYPGTLFPLMVGRAKEYRRSVATTYGEKLLIQVEFLFTKYAPEDGEKTDGDCFLPSSGICEKAMVIRPVTKKGNRNWAQKERGASWTHEHKARDRIVDALRHRTHEH